MGGSRPTGVARVEFRVAGLRLGWGGWVVSRLGG